MLGHYFLIRSVRRPEVKMNAGALNFSSLQRVPKQQRDFPDYHVASEIPARRAERSLHCPETQLLGKKWKCPGPIRKKTRSHTWAKAGARMTELPPQGPRRQPGFAMEDQSGFPGDELY